MDDVTLKKLNQFANVFVIDEKNSTLDTELFFNLLKNMYEIKPILTKGNNIEVFLSREETLKRVLEFYKSVDMEYYSIALDCLLQLKNKNLYIVRNNKEGIQKIKNIRIEGNSAGNTYDYLNNAHYIYALSGLKRNNIIYNEQRDILADSKKIVHEIAHCFDRKKIEGIFLIATSSKEKDMRNTAESKKIRKKIYEGTNLRHIFAEVTAVTFEKIYLDYLIENTEYSKNYINNLKIARFGDSLNACSNCYEALVIARIKKEKGKIVEKDIELLSKEFGTSREETEKRIEKLLEKSKIVYAAKPYAMAGIFAPTLIECYHKKGVDVLKQYIQAVKNNSIDQVFEVLQIEKNEKGIEKLIANVKKDIETFKPQISKENNEYER